MQEIALGFEFVHERNVASKSIARCHVMVQDDDLLSDDGQLLEFVLCRGDIDEGDECVFALVHSYAVVVAACDEIPAIAPGAFDGPDGPEAIRTARMVETEFFHGSSDLVDPDGSGAIVVRGG